MALAPVGARAAGGAAAARVAPAGGGAVGAGGVLRRRGQRRRHRRRPPAARCCSCSTRPAGAARRRLIAWWGSCVGLATAWWVGAAAAAGPVQPAVPRLHRDRRGHHRRPPTCSRVLRGTSHWVATWPRRRARTWPAGWALAARRPCPIAATVVAGRGRPGWRWPGATCPSAPGWSWACWPGWRWCRMGHLATVQGAWARAAARRARRRRSPRCATCTSSIRCCGCRWRSAIGAPGRRPPGGRATPAATRDLVRARPRPPGCAALVARGGRARAGSGPRPRRSPAGWRRPTGFEDVPAYWRQTAEFLAAERPSGRALLVPGLVLRELRVGQPGDEPMQPLAESPVGGPERDPADAGGAHPHAGRRRGPAGRGRGLGRADAVPRPGRVLPPRPAQRPRRHRGGLDPLGAGAPGAPGARPGSPAWPRSATSTRRPTCPRARPRRVSRRAAPAVEIYAVAGTAPAGVDGTARPPRSRCTAARRRVLALEDRGAGHGAAGAAGRGLAAADGTDHGHRCAAAPGTELRPGDRRDLRRPDRGRPPAAPGPRDYALPGLAQAQSVVDYLGGTPTASSSASDALGYGSGRLDAQPWAAVDSDPLTAWRPAWNPGGSRPEWWRLTTDEPFDEPRVTLVLAADLGGRRPAGLRLTTEPAPGPCGSKTRGCPRPSGCPPGRPGR